MSHTGAVQPGTSPDNPQVVALHELLGALSFALDLTEGQPEGHCMRACWIGSHIGMRLGFSEQQLWELFYTILLKDLGCSSNAARLCQLYLSDDRALKRAHKTMDGSTAQVLKFVLTQTGLKKGLAEKFTALMQVAKGGDEAIRDMMETRCQMGANIARMLRFPEPVAEGIQFLDEHWNGGGYPLGAKGPQIPAYSQIALLSQVADVFNRSKDRKSAVDEVTRRNGSWFGPEYVAAFQIVAADDDIWTALDDPQIDRKVFALQSTRSQTLVDDDYLDDIAAAFAKVVDNKSPFTGGHSDRVTIYSDLIARELGYDAEARRRLKRAALLHDIGKLGVSNTILDKPGKPDEDEWREIRMHPVYSEQILQRVPAFANLARIGGEHHERLDGKGYPKALKGDEIDRETRIVTVADVYDALTADRPYRSAMEKEVALNIMRRDLGTAFDPEVFAALEKALERM